MLKKMKSSSGYDYYIIVQKSYSTNSDIIVKKDNEINKDYCDCLSDFNNFMML